MNQASNSSRRQFIGGTLAATAAGTLLEAVTAHAAEKQPPAPPAEIKRKIKIGLIGCGGRGMWLADRFMKHGGYGGKVFVRGGDQHYVGQMGSVYNEGAERNIAAFYANITGGHFENANVQRAVDGHLTCILGREAAARKTRLTMEELLKENKKLEVDLKGLKA
jgi:hypothetical protein